MLLSCIFVTLFCFVHCFFAPKLDVYMEIHESLGFVIVANLWVASSIFFWCLSGIFKEEDESRALQIFKISLVSEGLPRRKGPRHVRPHNVQGSAAAQ